MFEQELCVKSSEVFDGIVEAHENETETLVACYLNQLMKGLMVGGALTMALCSNVPAYAQAGAGPDCLRRTVKYVRTPDGGGHDRFYFMKVDPEGCLSDMSRAWDKNGVRSFVPNTLSLMQLRGRIIEIMFHWLSNYPVFPGFGMDTRQHKPLSDALYRELDNCGTSDYLDDDFPDYPYRTAYARNFSVKSSRLDEMVENYQEAFKRYAVYLTIAPSSGVFGAHSPAWYVEAGNAGLEWTNPEDILQIHCGSYAEAMNF